MEEKKDFSYCPQCGMKYSINNSNGFCIHCGFKLENEKKENIVPVEEKKSYSTIPPAVIAIILLTVVIPAIVIILFFITLFGGLSGMGQVEYHIIMTILIIALIASAIMVPVLFWKSADNMEKEAKKEKELSKNKE